MKFILSLFLFLFSTIEIKADNANAIILFAKSKIGCGYVWAGEGQVLTQSTLDSLYNQYPDNIDKNVVSKWMGRQVYDCSGFVMKAFETIGISLIHNAESAWEETNWVSKGEIANLPPDKVCILYKYSADKGKMTHTGIYIGGSLFIHAKSSADGVVMEPMPYSWTHWGIPAGLY